MAFEFHFHEDDGEEAPPFSSNEAILEAFLAARAVESRPSTQKQRRYQLGAFMRPFTERGMLVTEITPRLMWQYVDQYVRTCRHYRRCGMANNGPGETYCAKGGDLTRCGAGACPMYQEKAAPTADKHLQCITVLFEFLEERQYVKQNFVQGIKKRWYRKNRRRFQRPPRRLPTKEEVRLLTRGRLTTSHRALYAVLAKTGARIGEVLRLRVDDAHFNLEEGWMRIPDFPGKRRGNRYLIVDDELRPILEEYLQWRTRRIRNRPDPGPAPVELIVNYRGNAFDPEAAHDSINRFMIAADLQRLGIAHEDGGRFTAHCFRHFFSDTLKKNGIDSYWWNVLRGDVPRGNEATYVHPTPEEIRATYMRYRPMLGILLTGTK